MSNELSMRTVRVSRKQTEAQGVASFDLVAADASALPAFTAGAHVMVHLSQGIVRPYSLCNDPAETGRYVIAVLAEPNSRGGSAAMHELQEGAELQISEPRNHFELAEQAPKHILFAGGIGITPLMAMAWRLQALGAEFVIHVCARTRARAAFVDHLLATPFGHAVKLHFDDGPAAQALEAALQQLEPDAGTHLYVCGPLGFMDHILARARAQRWPESHLHFESFTADLSVHASDMPFEVEIASTGRVLRIEPGKSVVDILSDHGIDLPMSCEMGVCGTCVTRILQGVPDHRDMYFTPEEHSRNDQFTPCCSRSKSARLVLDL